MKKLTEKTARTALMLEEVLGIPEIYDPLPVLDNLMLTLLSQNTNDINRDKAYHALRKRFPTWEAVMHADVKEIADAIRIAGLANQKSQRMQAILQWIYAQYGKLDLAFLCEMDKQEVIETFCQLKGVGIKTISVVLAFSCGVDIFPVDTHVHRLCNRIGLVKPSTTSPEQTFHQMQARVPAGKAFSFHLNLITHGRTICKARKPLCMQCPLRHVCDYAEAASHV
ncbi:MAG: endonuclease III [Candidatus Vecturithrix sp.]|jgi:endonuclease-3|nr:endonuclease III [Candidatus Vecturithrix sp.]